MDTARSIVHSVTHYIKNTDLYLMLLGLVCSIYGMLLIYSATLNPVTALDGSVIEPQDIPLPEAWGCWETEPLLLLAGVYLLLGRL